MKNERRHSPNQPTLPLVGGSGKNFIQPTTNVTQFFEKWPNYTFLNTTNCVLGCYGMYSGLFKGPDYT